MAALVSPIPKDHVRVHYHRPDLNYTGWKLYAFGNTTENTSAYFDGPVLPDGEDDFGLFFDVGIAIGAKRVGVIVHNPGNPDGDIKDPGPDMFCSVTRSREFWIISGDPILHAVNPLTANLNVLQAYWIDRDTVCIPREHFRTSWIYKLTYSWSAELPESLGASPSIGLTPAASLSPSQQDRFPQLEGYAVFKVDDTPLEVIAQALKCQLAVTAFDPAGPVAYLTGVQIAGVLDDLFFYDGPLGVSYSLSGMSVRLWAPTAQSVELLVFDTAFSEWPVHTIPMIETSGTWSAMVDGLYRERYYLYRVSVYVPKAQTILRNLVTDPYSVDLSINGTKSRFTDLNAPHTKPTGWDRHETPPLESFNDLSIYELHVRDFSVADTTVPEEHRGLYTAFTHRDSGGMRHLRELAEAGLKAVHLLPTFHFSSVNEDKLSWQHPGDLSHLPPESEHQQAAVTAVKDDDAYNWGYDPVHYMVPSGVYDFNDGDRVIEYRQMVQSLHSVGLRVIQDCVFNHTAANGQSAHSVLDRAVPTYYYRLDPNGNVYNATCCSDTASEHRMMERLMIDTLLLSAIQYKIDGFRFDLMNFHFVDNMRRIHDALAQVRPDIYLYGEGWNFGETVNDQLGPAARQANMYGMGIGAFNDRIRDGIRGGTPFSGLRDSGFATGADDSGDLLRQTDWIRIALAGNLRDYRLIDSGGNLVSGGMIDHNGAGAGYAASPSEVINYCSVHDNQTLFDAIQLKAPASEDTSARARRQVLAMSLIALGQAIPLFMAGDDLLRSKSLDQNSFNSGDWFNKIDWSGQNNNWGIGLPIASENQANWPIYKPLLADPSLKPTYDDIQFARGAFRELLRIRMSSGLFRMRTLNEIQTNLRFLNTGPDQIRRLIVTVLIGSGYGPYRKIAVFFNASTASISFADPALDNLQLHPIQQDSADPVVRTATAKDGAVQVPALTTAVFVSS